MRRIFWAIAWVALLAGAGQNAVAEGLNGLEKRRLQVEDMLQRLAGQRDSLAGRADSLAVRIDSLKSAGGDADELHDALRASMVLVRQLRALDQRLDSLALRRDELLEELRLAYDWEIGLLFQRLASGGDADGLGRLAQLQKARAALGEGGRSAALGYGLEMDVGPEDGPEEIRAKIELLEDMDTRLKSERRQLERRLGRLEEERRLRAGMGAFTGQLSLFDEHLPEGRVLRRQEGQGASGAEESRVAEVAFVPSVGDAPPPEADAVSGPLAVRQLDRAAGGLGIDADGAGDIQLEIGKVKARQLELRQLEAVLAQHLANFHEYLQKLKDGRE